MSEEVKPVETTTAPETKTEAPVESTPAEKPSLEQALEAKIKEKAAAERKAQEPQPEAVQTEVDAPQTSEAEAEPEKEPDSEEAPSDGIDLELAHRAFQVGMDQQEIAEYADDPKGLARTVAAFERRIRANQDSGQRPNPRQQAEEPKFEIPEFKEEDGFDPKIVGAFKAMQGEIERLRNERTAERQSRETERIAAEAEKFDTEIAASGMKELFGEGGISTLKDQKFAKNRVEVWNERRDYVARLQAQGRPIPPEKELMKRVIAFCFPDQVEAEARKKVVSGIKLMKKGMSNAPVQRKNATPVGKDDSFIQAFNKKMEAKG